MSNVLFERPCCLVCEGALIIFKVSQDIHKPEGFAHFAHAFGLSTEGS